MFTIIGIIKVPNKNRNHYMPVEESKQFLIQKRKVAIQNSVKMEFAIICAFLIFFNGYSSAITTIDLSEESDVSSEIEFFVIDANGGGKEKITNLNNYYYDIDLDLGALLCLAETNSTPISDLNEAFCQRYSDYLIVIERFLNDANFKYKEFKKEKQLLLFDFETACNMFIYFGISIEKLEIKNTLISFIDLRFSIVAKFVNEYACESLTQLQMDFMWAQTFEPFEKPFRKVESFAFFYIEELQNDEQLDKLFPRLKRLSLIFLYDVDYSYIDCVMPQLEHLQFFIDVFPDIPRHLDQIEVFLSKNPQIRSVDTNQVRMINKYLQNIENLTLHEFEIGDDENIRFESVKYLEVDYMSLAPLKQLSFPQLETLKMPFIPTERTTYVYLFKQYCKLKKFDFEARYSANDTAQLHRLLNELNDLIEIKLSMDTNINVYFINALIQYHNHLMRIEVLAQDIDVEDIFKKFGAQWNIDRLIPSDDYYKKALRMEKKRNAMIK